MPVTLSLENGEKLVPLAPPSPSQIFKSNGIQSILFQYFDLIQILNWHIDLVAKKSSLWADFSWEDYRIATQKERNDRIPAIQKIFSEVYGNLTNPIEFIFGDRFGFLQIPPPQHDYFLTVLDDSEFNPHYHVDKSHFETILNRFLALSNFYGESGSVLVIETVVSRVDFERINGEVIDKLFYRIVKSEFLFQLFIQNTTFIPAHYRLIISKYLTMQDFEGEDLKRLSHLNLAAKFHLEQKQKVEIERANAERAEKEKIICAVQ